jgi:uncharacterized protein
MKISLIEFSVENYKIFKERATFSMVYRKNEGKTFDSNGENLLKTSLIYGPNASGKSTLLEAIKILKNLVRNSADSSEKNHLPYYPFLFSDERSRPSFFEMVFSLGEKVLRYNFSINADVVVAENLIDESSADEGKPLFIRSFQNIVLFDVLKTPSSQDIFNEKTKDSVLFISSASQWKIKLAESIVEAIKSIGIIDGSNDDEYRFFTVKKFKEDENMKLQILQYLKRADFHIVDGIFRQNPVTVPEELKKLFLGAGKTVPNFVDSIKFKHSKYNSNNEVVGYEMLDQSDESNGTQRFFNVLGPIIDTINNGEVLMIDEFDNCLHPDLTRFILSIFEKENPNNAQLIATTHDTSLLGRKDHLFRSQVWFTTKDKTGAAELFSLEEFKKEQDLRNDTEFQKKYLEGRFGALPFIDFADV